MTEATPDNRFADADDARKATIIQAMVNLWVGARRPSNSSAGAEGSSLGTWGEGVFEDDMALDAKELWDAAREKKASPADATAFVVEKLGSAIPSEGDVIFFALASLQLDAGVLDDEISRYVIDAIPISLEAWRAQGVAEDVYARRVAALSDLRSRIEDYNKNR
jgi:hypothetical protein